MYPNRKIIFSLSVEEFNGTINVRTLKWNCATRWIKYFYSVHNFIKLLECVMNSLNTISYWNYGDISSQANSLRYSILWGELIISLLVLFKIFAIGLPLSKQLQWVDNNLRKAMFLGNVTLTEFKTIKIIIDGYFHNIYIN